MRTSKQIREEIRSAKMIIKDLEKELKKSRKRELSSDDIETVREKTKEIYLEMLDYPKIFSIDDDWVDGAIRGIIPESEWKEYLKSVDRLTFGSLNYIKWKGARIKTLRNIYYMIQSVLDMADEGEEVGIRAMWDPEKKILVTEGEFEY
jgi:hypothetical protein